VYVYELAAQSCQLEVEVKEEFKTLFVKGPEVILVVEEERCLAIGCLEGIPMLMTPVAMIRYAHVAHIALGCLSFLRRYREREHTVGITDDATVAIGLFHVMVPLLNLHLMPIAKQQLGEIPDRREIG